MAWSSSTSCSDGRRRRSSRRRSPARRARAPAGEIAGNPRRDPAPGSLRSPSRGPGDRIHGASGHPGRVPPDASPRASKSSARKSLPFLRVLLRDLTESLEQQAATGEILRVISSSPTDVQPVLEAVVEHAARLCAVPDADLFRVEGEELRVAAKVGPHPFWPIGEGAPINRDWVTGRAVVDRKLVHVRDLQTSDAEFPQGAAYARRYGHRTVLATPLLREGVPIGAILVRGMELRPFTDTQIQLLETFAAQAVIAIENARLFKELEQRNRDLSETLEQQTATGDILRAISSSPTDVQPVFDTIVESAVRLCDGVSATVYRFDGTLIHVSAQNSNVSAEARDAFHRRYPAPPSRASVVTGAILDRTVIHIRDFEDDPGATPASLEMARAIGHRSLLVVPLLRDGSPIGAIAVGRRSATAAPAHSRSVRSPCSRRLPIRPSSQSRMSASLRSWRQRNRDLTETLEQQTATGEILRVISSSPTDVQPVFDTIAQSAARLCEAEFCFVFRFDGELLHFVAQEGLTPEGVEALRGAWPMSPSLGERRREVGPQSRYRAHPGCPRGCELRAGRRREGRHLPQHRGRPDVARRRPDRSDHRLAIPGRSPSRPADRAPQDLRRPGRHRCRERPPLPGARAAQPRPDRDARAADRHRRDPAGHLELADRRRSPCSIPSLGALYDSAKRGFSAVIRYDGELLHLSAHAHAAPEGVDAMRRTFPMSPSRVNLVGRAVLTGAVVHLADVQADLDYNPTLASARKSELGRRANAARRPPDRGDHGAAVSRSARSPTRQIALLQTFADQAVIAIENVRLFTGAGAAQPRPDRDARAADRHRRDPAGHLQFADRRPARLRHVSPPTLSARAARR